MKKQLHSLEEEGLSQDQNVEFTKGLAVQLASGW